MTTHLRYAIGTAVGSLILTGFAIFLALDGRPWIGLSGLASAALLACDTRREAVLHRRRLAEHDLARRRALGETVPALDPCCLLNPRTKGQGHDHRCTGLGPRADFLPAVEAEHEYADRVQLLGELAVPELDGHESPFGWRNGDHR